MTDQSDPPSKQDAELRTTSSTKGTETKRKNSNILILTAFSGLFLASNLTGFLSLPLTLVGYLLAAVALFFELKHRQQTVLVRIGGPIALMILATAISVIRFYQVRGFVPPEGPNAGLLIPASDSISDFTFPPPPPDAPVDATRPAKGELLILAGQFAISTPEKSFVLLKLYGKDLLKIDRIKTGIAVSADIWNTNNKIVATIESNRFRVNPSAAIPITRPDPHTLLVDDDQKVRVLSVRFLNPTTIRIAGVFRADGKYPVVITETNITFGPLVIEQGVAFHLQGKSIFEWPGAVQNIPSLSDQPIAPGRARLHYFESDGAFNLAVEDQPGRKFSIFQIGGSDVPAGTHIWVGGSFKIRDLPQ